MAVKTTQPIESFSLPYTLFKNFYTTISCVANEDEYIVPVTKFQYSNDPKINAYVGPYELPFKELLKFDTANTHASDTTFKLGMGYIAYTMDGMMKQMPIDMIVNNSAINNLGNLYKGNTTRSFSYENGNVATIKNILENENIYYIIKYLRFLDNHALKRNEALYTNTSSMYYQLYNDTVSGEPYCKYIYRAKIKRSDIGFSNKNTSDLRVYMLTPAGNPTTTFAKIPVFRVETNDPNLNFHIVIRNFKIPMKRVRTSSKAFIYLCPEYILKEYTEFIDAITYIISNRSADKTYKFYYDYLKDTQLWVHDIENGEYKNYGIKLGNTNSTISFIE